MIVHVITTGITTKQDHPDNIAMGIAAFMLYMTLYLIEDQTANFR